MRRAASWGVGIVCVGWVMALGACEVSIGRCDEDDAGRCIDSFPDWDSGWLSGDAGSLPGDAGTSMDSAVVGMMDGGGAPGLSIGQFCQAQLASAVKWRDLFDRQECGCSADEKREAIAPFLQVALAYGGEDPEGSCISARSASVTAQRVQYVGANAAACASKFAGQFGAPPASCPVDIAAYEAQIAHGAQQLAQIAECRSAFVGQVARDGACADSLECQAGLRCLPIVGSATTTTCRPARAMGETCARSVDCADGHVCAGAGTARTCIPANQLRLNNGPCSFSFECITGLVCGGAATCVTPTQDVVCGP